MPRVYKFYENQNILVVLDDDLFIKRKTFSADFSYLYSSDFEKEVFDVVVVGAVTVADESVSSDLIVVENFVVVVVEYLVAAVVVEYFVFDRKIVVINFSFYTV